MDSLLESFRILHEERERLLEEMAQELAYNKNNLREEINSGHRFRRHLNRYQECCKKLVELYEDQDELKKDEINSISGANEFAEFYGRIRNSKETHRRYPDIVDSLVEEFNQFKTIRDKRLEDDSYATFTDEESYGKFFDLHQNYQEFMNIESVKSTERFTKLTYLEFLNTVSRLYDLHFDLKNNAQYEAFVKNLEQYLYGFIDRARPMLDIDAELAECDKQFENQWTCGDFPGWPAHLLNLILQQSTSKPDINQLVDFNKYDTPEKLESLGLDELKSILQTYGLKCGGNIKERAKRVFVLKSHSLNELDSSYFPSKKSKSAEDEFLKGFSSHYKSLNYYKTIAKQESHINLYFEILKETLFATVDNTERKQARTAEEILDEENLDPLEIETEVKSEDEDYQDPTLYNPKNLPLDFDGKPIPYWLYKLHGLNIYYNCEICGNSKYRGPKAFQRHFGEWRHAHGMRCLGIPNTAHFVNVTKIQDAYNLWDVIKNSKTKEQWNPDNDEEFEDSDGNPINKKIFDDMRRQGFKNIKADLLQIREQIDRQESPLWHSYQNRRIDDHSTSEAAKPLGDNLGLFLEAYKTNFDALMSSTSIIIDEEAKIEAYRSRLHKLMYELLSISISGDSQILPMIKPPGKSFDNLEDFRYVDTKVVFKQDLQKDLKNIAQDKFRSVSAKALNSQNSNSAKGDKSTGKDMTKYATMRGKRNRSASIRM